ncbi:hypothetical protein DCAR_0311672 [Daucus carota subsp. sativus]|uniref:Zinc finger PHD-type domain-containing protein n=1 Tax=Daucus carota subsp. sativus TaxID=79200 RepID=A0AAF0WN57_DAUCS|nr:hypothetical protein DCAR_0311672 [Daucus carota subsp. sativus]
MATTCLKCGSQSWDNAFVCCSRCEDCVVHRYCLDVIPNTLDEIVTWYCEDCQEDLTPSTKEAHGSGSMNIRDTNSTDTEDHMGAFVIINKKRGTYDGVVAHISNKACSKVCEKARSLENFLHFEKHPKSDVWPKSFQNSLPSDESIALYFLPADRSGEEVFENLVDYMIGDEIALKATIEDAELLVFSSTELPLSYWRFQGKYYLWGVFRGKRAA